jgi:hypothetical protein
MSWLACFLWVLLLGVLLGLLLSRLLGLLFSGKGGAGESDSDPGTIGRDLEYLKEQIAQIKHLLGSDDGQPNCLGGQKQPVDDPCSKTWFNVPSLKKVLGLDDLNAGSLGVILGIDEKVSAALQANGIMTLFDLASADPQLLSFILDRNGITGVHPSPQTWPRQAQYIIENRVEDLQEYRKELAS